MKKFLALILGGFLFLNLVSAASSSMVVSDDETKTFTVDGVEHELTLRYIDGGAAVELDGVKSEYPNHLEEGDTFTANGVEIRAVEVVYNASTGEEYLNFTAVSSGVPNICKEVASNCARPLDMDNDGLYEDIDGHEDLDFQDVELFWKAYRQDVNSKYSGLGAYDFSGNGQGIDVNDVQSLVDEAERQSGVGSFGFEKTQGDWRAENGHYGAFKLDINDDGKINFADVRQLAEDRSKYGNYDTSSRHAELKYDYNCDGSVSSKDLDALFSYAHLNGDSSTISKWEQGSNDVDRPNLCDYDGDGTAYYMEENKSSSESGTALKCSDVASSGTVKDYDADGDGYIGGDELSAATDDWRNDKLTNEQLNKVEFAVKNECKLDNSGSSKPGMPSQTAETYTLEIASGWNMVSVPAGASSSLEQACNLKGFGGNPFWSLQGSGWERTSMMNDPENGYLVYAQSSCDAELVPTPASSSGSVDLGKGWNTLSVPRETSISAASTNCNFEGGLWYLNSNIFSWEEMSVDDTLDPMRGYYVKTESQCSVKY